MSAERGSLVGTRFMIRPTPPHATSQNTPASTASAASE